MCTSAYWLVRCLVMVVEVEIANTVMCELDDPHTNGRLTGEGTRGVLAQIAHFQIEIVDLPLKILDVNAFHAPRSMAVVVVVTVVVARRVWQAAGARGGCRHGRRQKGGWG